MSKSAKYLVWWVYWMKNKCLLLSTFCTFQTPLTLLTYSALFWVLLKSSSILRIKYRKRFVFSCNPPMMIKNPWWFQSVKLPNLLLASWTTKWHLLETSMRWFDIMPGCVTSQTLLTFTLMLTWMESAKQKSKSNHDWITGVAAQGSSIKTDHCHKFAHVTMGRTWTKLSKGRYFAKNALHRITLCCICCKRLNYIALHSFVHARTWY